MTAVRKTMTIDPQASMILDAVGNASRYVSQLVQHRRAAWMAAVGELSREGVASNEAFALLDALAPLDALGPAGPGMLSSALKVAGPVVRERWNIDAKRWRRLALLAQRSPLTEALFELATERACSNVAVATALDALG